jgi:spermidine synthase
MLRWQKKSSQSGRKVQSSLPAVLMLGTVAQTGQILFLRELLMAFHGNEFLIGLILATWLAWVGVGSYLGLYLVHLVGRPLFLLVVNSAAVLLVLPATLLIMRNLRWFFDVLPGAQLSLLDMAISCVLLLAPVCLLLGAQFVMLARVWREREGAADTSSAGKTYIGEAVGGVLGGVLFTFLLVHYLNPFQIAVLAGMVMLAAGLYLIPKAEINPVPMSCRRFLAGFLAVAVISFPFLAQVDAWAYSAKWQHFLPQHQLAGVYQSRYGTIGVVRLEEQYSFFQSGHLIFSIAGPKAAAVGLEEQEAVEFAHLAMVQHKNPADVLLIGGGLRGILREILKHPVERVDYIELDEVLTKAAWPYLSPATQEAFADPRVRLIHTDGRLFVKTAQQKYDMIIIDAPKPATAALNRYFTKEFFHEAKRLLRPDGVFVIGAASTPGLRGVAVANRNSTIYHTLAAVFTRVLIVGDRFLYFFASNYPAQISSDAAVLAGRYTERNIEAKGFSPRHYYLLLQETKLRRVNWLVRNHGRSPGAYLTGPKTVPLNPGSVAEQEAREHLLPPVDKGRFINSDFKPTGYFYTLMFLDELARAGYEKVFRWLLQVKSWWILMLFTLPLLAVLGLRLFGGSKAKKPIARSAVLFSVFMTGFSTMALQIVLLFSFQSVYGFIFEMVGLIMSVFMGGLALGAYLTSRYVVFKTRIDILAGAQLLTAVSAFLIAALLPAVAAVQSPAGIFALFSLMTFGTGLINGINFPLSAASLLTLDQHAEKSTGAVYGVELFGACLGAILASLLMVPIFGIIVSCLIAGAANGAAFLTLLSARRSYLWLQKTRLAD